MTVLDGFLQGLLQGLTEFLPISSSGHLSLYQHFSGNAGTGSLLFTVMLHLGTLAAVVAVYYEDLWGMLKEVGAIFREIFTGQFSIKTRTPSRWLLYMLILACLPMLLLIPLNGFVENIAQDNDIVVEGVFFLVTSLLLFASAKAKPGRAGLGKMKAPHALIIGGIQTIAAVPGLSRSGSTISTGMILGFDRQFAAKFSFLLGIPAILGGAVFELGDAMKEQVKIDILPMFIGILTAAVVGYIAIRVIRYILQKDKWIIFAWYTLALGAIVVVVGIIEHIAGAVTGGGSPSSASTSAPASASALAMIQNALALLR